MPLIRTDVRCVSELTYPYVPRLTPFILKDQPLDELEASTATVTAPISYTGASGSDDYYQTVVINALLGILKDQSLGGQHHTVIEAIMSIFKTQGLKCVTFLPQVGGSDRFRGW